MNNIVIFTDRHSNIEDVLKQNEEYDVRTKSIDEVKDAADLNLGLAILDCSEDKLKEYTMTMKFNSPILLAVDNISPDIKAHGDVFDFIKRPVNEYELKVRAKALLKLKELRTNVSLISTTDELTGLHNRRYLHERLEAEISRARRYGTKLSCLLIDIDFFKVVNDMYGYDWGDILLKRIAEMLSGLIRKEDILTRYGDEEFIVILPNTEEDKAYIFAERFRRDIEKMEFIPLGQEERHPITISGGISSYPFLENVDENANTLIRYAEHALYNAKKRGKNKIVQFSQMNLEY